MGDIYRSIPNKGSSAKGGGIFTDLFQTKEVVPRGGYLQIYSKQKEVVPRGGYF